MGASCPPARQLLKIKGKNKLHKTPPQKLTTEEKLRKHAAHTGGQREALLLGNGRDEHPVAHPADALHDNQNTDPEDRPNVRYLKDEEGNEEDAEGLQNDHHRLGYDVREDVLIRVHPRHQRPLQQAVLPLQDQGEGGGGNGGEESQREDEPGRHELGDGRVGLAEDGLANLEEKRG